MSFECHVRCERSSGPLERGRSSGAAWVGTGTIRPARRGCFRRAGGLGGGEINLWMAVQHLAARVPGRACFPGTGGAYWRRAQFVASTSCCQHTAQCIFMIGRHRRLIHVHGSLGLLARAGPLDRGRAVDLVAARSGPLQAGSPWPHSPLAFEAGFAFKGPGGSLTESSFRGQPVDSASSMQRSGSCSFTRRLARNSGVVVYTSPHLAVGKPAR